MAGDVTRLGTLHIIRACSNSDAVSTLAVRQGCRHNGALGILEIDSDTLEQNVGTLSIGDLAIHIELGRLALPRSLRKLPRSQAFHGVAVPSTRGSANSEAVVA